MRNAVVASKFIVARATAGAQADLYSGSSDFRVYCGSCHGVSGKGDGSIAKSLKKPPPDLTQLKVRSRARRENEPDRERSGFWGYRRRDGFFTDKALDCFFGAGAFFSSASSPSGACAASAAS